MSYGNKEVILAAIDFKVGSGGVVAGKAVKLDNSGDVVLATAITDKVVGVALTTQSQGDTVSVQFAGVAKMVASGTVTLADEVMVVGSGTGEVATAAGATAYSIGRALTTAATTGRVMVLLMLAGKTPANS